MINNLLSLLTYENIYLIANWGVIPFWLLLILIQIIQLQIFHSVNNSTAIIGYSLCLFILFDLHGGNILDSFELYSGLDGLYSMFANEALLLIFWLHFLAISLFAGSWIVKIAEDTSYLNCYDSLFDYDLFYRPNRINYLLVF